jgi:N-acetyl-anhydromuramyl-L-alanine amidase AmpD
VSFPFVQAFHRFGPRKGPVKAFVVHMAEGGGTVGFLSRRNRRGVSVHYVIERDGRIVQMVRESEATGSINPNDLRTTEGPTPYGAKVRREVMGEWDHDPNSATITLEMEGFAATGPNAAQSLALGVLVRDVRSRHPTMGLLGHRDFTSRKACPGGHIPWAAIGGHGPASGSEDDSMAIFTRTERAGSLRITKGSTVSGYDLSGDSVKKAKEQTFSDDSTARFGAVLARMTGESPTPLLEVTSGAFSGLYVPTTQVQETFDPPADGEVLDSGTYVVL